MRSDLLAPTLIYGLGPLQRAGLPAPQAEHVPFASKRRGEHLKQQIEFAVSRSYSRQGGAAGRNAAARLPASVFLSSIFSESSQAAFAQLRSGKVSRPQAVLRQAKLAIAKAVCRKPFIDGIDLTVKTRLAR